MLDGIRVLDLADEDGLLCGQILADLGADVYQAPPNNAVDPFFWQAYTRNKHLFAEHLTAVDVLDLAAHVDVIVETRGELDVAALHARNPGLIVASISPFGANGPKSDYLGSDLPTAWPWTTRAVVDGLS